MKALFVSPRAGIAWDIFGKGNTVLRGGFGAYRWRDQYNDVAGAMGPRVGMRSYSTPNPMYLKDIDSLSSSGKLTLSSGAYAVNPNDDQQPLTYTYSMTISQKVPWSSLLEVAYVGNQSEHMNITGSLINKNLIPVGALFLPNPVTGEIKSPNDVVISDYRPYQAYKNGALNIYNHGSYSNYNGLQVSWNRQKGSVLFGANYTFSKALGIRGDTDPFHLNGNYGILNEDRTQALNLNYSVEIGNRVHGISPLLRAMANGWSISGITTLQSGPNLQTAYGGNLGLSIQADNAVTARTMFGTDAISMFPILLCSPASGLTKGHQYINGDCFGAPSIGNNGPNRMPYVHGPAYFNSDLSLKKSFRVSERHTMEFRAAAFNFLNHPLWSFDPNNLANISLRFAPDANGKLVVTAPDKQQYGVVNTKYGRRVVELTLRYAF